MVLYDFLSGLYAPCNNCDSFTGIDGPLPKNGTVKKGLSCKLILHFGLVWMEPISSFELVSILHPPNPHDENHYKIY